MKKTFVRIIKIYQKAISPFLGRRCRFYPTCSSYAVLAIEKYGTLKGTWMSFLRVLKCNPFHRGGVDIP